MTNATIADHPELDLRHAITDTAARPTFTPVDRSDPTILSEYEAQVAADVAVLQAEALADLRRDSASLEAVLDDMRIGVCYDLRSRRAWWRSGDGDWRASTDRFTADLRERIASRYTTGKSAPLTFGDDTWKRSLDALLHHRERDLFVAWLEALPGWDGDDRLGEWLHVCFELPGGYDDPLARWASRYLPLAAVTRAYQPGAKIDELPVLLGAQGLGKSTAVRLLLPPDEAARYGWFSDSLNLSGDDKLRSEALQGRVIVEISELQGGTRAELDSLKAFLTRTDDGGVRLAYRRDPEPAPRRAAMIGTANPGPTGSLPNDVGGLRRFVALDVTDGDPARIRDYLAEHRLQLWAQARYEYWYQSAEARLPEALFARQAAANEQHRRRDAILEDELAAWTDKQTEPFTLAQAAYGLGLANARDTAASLDRATASRLSRALRAAGYDRNRTYRDGVRIWVWQLFSGISGISGINSS